MEKKGWIKLYRKEMNWADDLTDQELRYYLSARLIIVWDLRNHLFGTFDARTKLMKQEVLPNWSTGKINMVKNSLMRKGLLQKTKDSRRLRVTNAEIWMKKGNKFENLIQSTENNLHSNEHHVQLVGKEEYDLSTGVAKLVRKQSINF